jgi:hypothetical protein
MMHQIVELEEMLEDSQAAVENAAIASANETAALSWKSRSSMFMREPGRPTGAREII